MILECACGKMYKVRDDSANPPTKCPSCGGALKAAGGPPAAGADPRLKELELKVASLEKISSATRAALELKDKELAEARKEISRLQEEASSKPDGGASEDEARRELQEAQASIARLGEELAKAQKAYQEALKKKEDEIHELRSKGQTLIVGALKEKQAEIDEAQASIARLGEDLAKAQKAYHEALDKKDQELSVAHEKLAEMEKKLAAPAPTWGGAPAEGGGDLERAQARISSLEKIVQDTENRNSELRAQLEEAAGTGPSATELRDKTQALERAQARIATLEKVVQDSEQRYSMLKEELEASVGREGNPQALAEKDKVIAALEEEVAARRGEIAQLQKRIEHLDQLRAADQGSFDTRLTASDAAGARVGEARYLAGDLQRSLESIEAALSGLVHRVKRLHDTLHSAEEEKKAPGAPAVPAPRPPTAVLTPSAPPPVKPPSAPMPAARPPTAALAAPKPPSAVQPKPPSGVGRAPTVIGAPPPPAPTTSVPFEVEPVPAADSSSEDLESFPEPAMGDDLPADETLLDMGKIGKKVQNYEKPELREEPAGSPDEVRFVDSGPEESAEPGAPAPEEAELTEGPLSAETSPGPVPEEDDAQPKKKGFFGKLFGKK